MSKEYFPHDYAARLSLRGIRKDYGMAGVGFYWCFIEILHEEGGYVKERDLEDIAYDLQTDPQMCSAIVHNYGLFSVRKGKIHSERVLRNIKKRADVSAARRRAAEGRWGGNDPVDEPCQPEREQQEQQEDEHDPEPAHEEAPVEQKEKDDERADVSGGVDFWLDDLNRQCDFWRDEMGGSDPLFATFQSPPEVVRTRIGNLFKLIGKKDTQTIGGQVVRTSDFMKSVLRLFWGGDEKRWGLYDILREVDDKAAKGEVKNKQNYLIAALYNSAMLNGA